MNLYIGCPIWSFKGWVGNFYPEGTKPADFLYEYAKRLTTVEGNTTFYAVPAAKTIDGWAESLPETFRFCPKVPKAISHEGKLMENVERAREFIDVMRRLGTRLGPMFLQLPPRYSPKLFGDLKAFLTVWPRDVRLAVEVRHLDWFESPDREALNQLLSEHNMARVVIDTRPIRSLDGDKILEGSVYQTLLAARERKPNVPILPERTADFIFLRYIGHPQMEQNEALLMEWAGYVASELSAGADAYVFCHSPENLAAPYLCREFHHRVSEKVDIPSLPWDEIDAMNFEQGELF
ncbi:MAG TPA: DUF72 domain-containing protein [Anaerolineales bacterium]|nr:DUF72 domain-containing protein [Anaerolineales bacterium]